jgi:ribonuclease P protein component
MLLRARQVQPAAETASASVAVERLRRRADFVAMRGAARDDRAAFTLRARQCERPGNANAEAIRFGFTVTMKTGNAVERNRIRRRLREAVRRNSGDNMLPGHDYELIGKRAALTTRFDAMCGQLDKALSNVARRMKSTGSGTMPASQAE